MAETDTFHRPSVRVQPLEAIALLHKSPTGQDDNDAEYGESLPSFVIVEDFPSGYPRFSALIGAHPAFSLSRKFATTRARLLLLKQDHVSVLEEKLRQLDHEEARLLFLGSLRRDCNSERKNLLHELDRALADYDALVERNGRILQLPTATRRHRLSLINWVEGTGSICRREASFLYEPDLCASSFCGDAGLTFFESLVERVFIHFRHYFQEATFATVSRDENVFIFTGSTLTIAARIVLSWLLILLLLVPIVVMHSVEETAARIICIMVASGMFISILSGLIHARMAEIFVAGAT